MLRWFPPVNSGGLIEASPSRGRLPACVARFPPVNSGGLIEARPHAAAVGSGLRSSITFPPVNSGGLIEALRH